ncbi:MAG: outer membrane protein beta-barrel domain [Bacteroidota bacterium]
MKYKLKCFFILLTVVHCTTIYAQDTPKKHTHKNKLSIGLMYSPDVYIYNFKTKGLSVPDYNVQMNYSLGGTIIYHPLKLLTLRAAFLFSTKGYSVDYSYDASNLLTLDLQSKTQNFDLKYLDIPLMLNLNLIHKDHLQFFLSAGIIPSVLLQKSGFSTQQDNSTKNTDLDNITDFLAGATYSFGLKYNLTHWLGIGFEPYYKTYFNRVDSQSMDLDPLSFGAKFTTVINFNHY